MRKKHLNILWRAVKEGRLPWLLRQAARGLLIPCSAILRRPLTGPVFGGLVVTYRCNEACPMCEVRKLGDRSKELSTAGMLKIIDEFAELKVSGLSITGGEPLVREDILELLHRLNKHRIPTSMSTNGLKLTDPALCRELLETGIDSIAISLDGATSDEHNHSRGKSNAFDQTMTGLKTLLSVRDTLGLRDRCFITLASVINRENALHFEDLLKLAGDLGVNNVSLNPVHSLTKTGDGDLFFGRGDEENLDLSAYLLSLKDRYPFLDSSRGYLSILNGFLARKPFPTRCFAPYFSLYIDCFDRILPCAGHFYECKPAFDRSGRTLTSLWYSPELQKVRSSLHQCRCCYFSCMAELNLTYSHLPFMKR